MPEVTGREHKPLNHEPSQTAEYLEKRYWDERFQQEEEYDWFKKFEDFSHLVLPKLSKSDRILILGCGNSSLSFDLCKLGYNNITSIDLSEVVIERMQLKAKELDMMSLRWQVADMLALPFEDHSFDVVLEKGTMDVLFVDNDSPWQPKPEVCARVKTLLQEVHRVLTKTGMFLSITFAQPHFRKRFFTVDEFSWSMQYETFGETFHYFVYTLAKGNRRPEDHQANTEKDVSTISESPMHDHMDEEGFLLNIGV